MRVQVSLRVPKTHKHDASGGAGDTRLIRVAADVQRDRSARGGLATYTRGVADSRPAKTVRMDIKISDCIIYAPVAQWIEQRPSKPQIAGSNPVRSTICLVDADGRHG